MKLVAYFTKEGLTVFGAATDDILLLKGPRRLLLPLTIHGFYDLLAAANVAADVSCNDVTKLLSHLFISFHLSLLLSVNGTDGMSEMQNTTPRLIPNGHVEPSLPGLMGSTNPEDDIPVIAQNEHTVMVTIL